MQMPICTKCKKNIAVVFMSKIENGQTIQEGLCLKCASELGLKPVEDLMQNMGISADDIDMLTSQMPEDLSEIEEMMENMSEEDQQMLTNTATGSFSKIFENLLGKKDDTNSSPSLGFMPNDKDDEDFDYNPPQKKAKKTSKKSKKAEEKEFKLLTSYCNNLSQKAKDGNIDNVIGRDSEIQRVVQILNRRQKNNPCLIGEPGVGKTAIAEGLAVLIDKGEVPYKLQNKEVFLLDLTALVAGTQFRGQFESRVRGLIEEIKKHGNVILVIDEVHNLVGAGDSEGSMNAANILKPALSRGEIQVIGATTFAEYRKHIEKDGALERRFQTVIVAEPSIESATNMLIGIKSYYEQYHGVTISDAVLREAVVLSERYITDRFLPDKAIDLIDEACSDINLKNKNIIKAMKLKKEIELLELEKSQLLDTQSELPEDADQNEIYAKIAEIRFKVLGLEAELEQVEKIPYPELEVSNLAKVIEVWTKIPASKVEQEEISKLLGLEERLRERVIGQDEAVSAIAKGIRRQRAGISPKKKPASFIFVGPTGVGKTELTKAIAEDLFDTPEALIRLDMSEYMEKHSVSRLIGAPPGYVGYDEAGQLTEKIRRRPYSVILFDEIEKAHPDALNTLLQILDDGKVSDAHGRQVNFENTIIVMTSNAGSNTNDVSLGFGKSISEQSKEKSMRALSEIMRPEFLNRIDKIVSFNKLSEENFIKIAKKMIGELEGSLETKGIILEIDDQVYGILAEKSFSLKFGARNLRRTIEELIEDEIAIKVIDSYNNPFKTVQIKVLDGEISIVTC
ncbi:MAG: ATP-dependent Clp protease ATP-binding subunit [Clostridia bacterium]